MEQPRPAAVVVEQAPMVGQPHQTLEALAVLDVPHLSQGRQLPMQAAVLVVAGMAVAALVVLVAAAMLAQAELQTRAAVAAVTAVQAVQAL